MMRNELRNGDLIVIYHRVLNHPLTNDRWLMILGGVILPNVLGVIKIHCGVPFLTNWYDNGMTERFEACSYVPWSS